MMVLCRLVNEACSILPITLCYGLFMARSRYADVTRYCCPARAFVCRVCVVEDDVVASRRAFIIRYRGENSDARWR